LPRCCAPARCRASSRSTASGSAGASTRCSSTWRPFQKIADLYHNGSLEALVRHHLASADATFHAEGAAVRAMMDSAAALRAASAALNADLAHQLLYLVRHTDPSIARATWDIFVPSVPLSLEALVFAGLVGLCVWLLAALLWRLVAALYYRAIRTTPVRLLRR
jgi:hypothetical protein